MDLPRASKGVFDLVAVGSVGSDAEDECEVPEGCCDQDVQCAELAEDGECEANPLYMEVACQHTCGTCRPLFRMLGCQNLRVECEGWGQCDECDTNPAFININYPATCNSCPPTGSDTEGVAVGHESINTVR